MPNRIIKESIRTSEKVNNMSDLEFRLWVNLIVFADDYGRGNADPRVIKGYCFPLRKISPAAIEKTLEGLEKLNALILYNVDGKDYFSFPHWGEHQNIRNKKSKYPAPPLKNDTCNQLQADARKSPRNPIQSNPNPIRIQSEYVIPDFDEFWAAYPKKVGKQEAVKAWNKAFTTDGELSADTLLTALEHHKRSKQWTEDNGKFIPNASTWLNQHRWEDQLEEVNSNDTVNGDSGGNEWGIVYD